MSNVCIWAHNQSPDINSHHRYIVTYENKCTLLQALHTGAYFVWCIHNFLWNAISRVYIPVQKSYLLC